MTDTPDLRDQIADALNNASDRPDDERLPDDRHSEHKYHWRCLVCRGDVDALAAAAADRVAPLLAAKDRENADLRRDLRDARAALAELQETAQAIRLSESAAIHNVNLLLWLHAEASWRLSEEIRTNPGPTQWAYDQACAALHKHRARGDDAERERDEARAEVDLGIRQRDAAVEDVERLRAEVERLRAELAQIRDVQPCTECGATGPCGIECLTTDPAQPPLPSGLAGLAARHLAAQCGDRTVHDGHDWVNQHGRDRRCGGVTSLTEIFGEPKPRRDERINPAGLYTEPTDPGGA